MSDAMLDFTWNLSHVTINKDIYSEMFSYTYCFYCLSVNFMVCCSHLGNGHCITWCTWHHFLFTVQVDQWSECFHEQLLFTMFAIDKCKFVIPTNRLFRCEWAWLLQQQTAQADNTGVVKCRCVVSCSMNYVTAHANTSLVLLCL